MTVKTAANLQTRAISSQVTQDLSQNLAFVLSRAQNLTSSRRSLLLAPLLAALPLALVAGPAEALDPAETQITLPNQFKWKPWTEGPPHSAEMSVLYGDPAKPGLYVLLMKWYPGFMSAPHTYVTDRLCFVLSGTWWVNSGKEFRPQETVPVPAGGFVRRVAYTPHYDGVKKGAKEPVVVGIFGQAPIDLKLVDPEKPQWRAV
jgi:hypothetical protein